MTPVEIPNISSCKCPASTRGAENITDWLSSDNATVCKDLEARSQQAELTLFGKVLGKLLNFADFQISFNLPQKLITLNYLVPFQTNEVHLSGTRPHCLRAAKPSISES